MRTRSTTIGLSAIIALSNFSTADHLEGPKLTLKCFHCGREFKTDDGLKHHVSNKHLNQSPIKSFNNS